MEFFNQAITVRQILVIAWGAGLGIWRAINLLEGYGNDNPGAKSQGMKQHMAGSGQQVWQILPLSPTGYGDSSYQSCSVFAGNPYFIDLEVLAGQGLLQPGELADICWGSDLECIDYGALFEHRPGAPCPEPV